MNDMHELIDLEEQGWRALSSAGDAGKKFYASVLREDAVMLFPGGMRIAGRERILESLGTQPWDSFQIENPTVIPLASNAAALVYTAKAQRKGSEPYVALISSTYVHDRTWQLVVHQQTPA
ncbi:hypothetical protein GCM10011487_04810 [Steroidobacter agaridevorans]|uniref:DUF4440 domain-containing protein n=2 Tax=Steroidobacter agaridevorans TaxID=2695856 RepID=A0A829Y648_9GAMM|nr:hypothetical protein GCM10011487_04810 [Steroidobacter agaridevorans]